MKLSMKTDYALRALVDLAPRFGQVPVQSADIAARQGIPEPYLDQLLTVLRKAGIIRSVRGPQGGHTLAKTAAQTTVAEVVLALEGWISPVTGSDPPEAGGPATSYAIREMWQEWQAAAIQLLESKTIAELAERQRECAQAITYAI